MSRAQEAWFRFNQRKAGQAAGYLLRNHGRDYKYILLIRLLYMADRACLLATGTTISGDRMYSMDNGPVLGCVYDCLKPENEQESSAWLRYVTKPRPRPAMTVRATGVDETDTLSDYEIELLNRVYSQYGHWAMGDLVDHLHTLPEYQDAYGSSIPIDPGKILASYGWEEDEIASARDDARSVSVIDGLLAE